MMEKKLSEGNEYVIQAEKCLKTSFMKWRPDYDCAASEYSKAATCFKGAKALDKCKDSLLKAADCYGKNQSFFSAAKSLEQAAFISKDLEDYDGVVDLVSRSCQLFREHGTPDTAAMVLEKGAKMVESKYPEKAVELYIKASDIVSSEERSKQAADYAAKAARLLVKLKRYNEALTMLKKELNGHLEAEDSPPAGRVVICICFLQLNLDDFVAADKIFKEYGSYIGKDERMSVMDLLEGFDQGDPEQVLTALKNPFFKYMDVEYAKLARNLSEKFQAQKDGAATTSQGAVGGKETEDFSGSLL